MKKYVFESLKFFCAAILCTILSAFATPSHAALPDGYTELQYIESTGTQYIDTGIVPNQDTSVRLDAQYLDYNSGSNGILFGARTSSMVNVYVVQRLTAGDWNMGYNNGSVIVGTADTNRHIFYKNKQYQYLDGELKGTGTYSAFTCPGTAILFGFNNNGTPNTTDFPAKVYSLKIYDNNTLVRDFVPAKNSSGVIGMYDTVNNRFYTNAGTGEFVAGPDACNGTIVNYTSATGTGVQNGTPTPTNPIEPVFYQQGNMVLRKVGDYADSYDATTGKITRRVGVKVLDGTESWYLYGTRYVSSTLDGTAKQASKIISSHFESESGVRLGSGNGRLEIFQTAIPDLPNAAELRTWLAQQYAAGTPVMLYYPLVTETTEDWTETSYCFNPIKIATTKYNETAFGPLNTALANAISVVDSVVSNTITQAASIATLQAQKQTRPNDIADDNEKCPAGKKCLLVEDTSGIPHWYEIVETLLPAGYIQLQYIEATGRQYINTGILINKTLAKKLTLESEMLVTSTGGYRLCGIGGAESQFYFGLNPSTHFAYGSGNTDADTNKIASLDTWYKYSYSPKNGKYTVRDSNDEVVTSTSFNFSENFSVKNYPILLFAYASSGGGATGVWSGKISSFKVYEENVLIQDMVPARSASGVVGMFDLVSGTFFENAGTGEFVAGPVAE